MTSQQLRMIRCTLGMTRKCFGDRVGLSTALIDKIERGEWKVTERTKYKILSTFKMNDSDIADLTEWYRKFMRE